MLSNFVARHWPNTESNAVHPGWVASKLAGSGAPGSTQSGADTLVHLAAPILEKKVGTGQYFSSNKATEPAAAALDEKRQDELIGIYEKLSGVRFPR